MCEPRVRNSARLAHTSGRSREPGSRARRSSPPATGATTTRRGAARRRARRRPLAGARRPVLLDAARRSRRAQSSRSRARPATTPASWVPPEHDGVSTYYLSINRNKRSIVLDFGDADDLALARELLRRADITIENFKAGGLDKFGLDYASGCTSSTPGSSTCRSAASAPPKARGSRATTSSSRPSPG